MSVTPSPRRSVSYQSAWATADIGIVSPRQDDEVGEKASRPAGFAWGKRRAGLHLGDEDETGMVERACQDAHEAALEDHRLHARRAEGPWAHTRLQDWFL